MAIGTDADAPRVVQIRVRVTRQTWNVGNQVGLLVTTRQETTFFQPLEPQRMRIMLSLGVVSRKNLPKAAEVPTHDVPLPKKKSGRESFLVSARQGLTLGNLSLNRHMNTRIASLTIPLSSISRRSAKCDTIFF
jgi:hypothetical protein